MASSSVTTTKSESNNDSYDDDDYEYSFRNSPPNLQPAFKHYASETLRNIRSALRSAIACVDIDCALYHIGILVHYLDLRYPITRRIRSELCSLLLILLFEFPSDLMQQITVMKVCAKLIKNENLGTVGLSLSWKPFYNLLIRTHYSSLDGSTQCDSGGILSSHCSHLESLISVASAYFDRSSFAEIMDCILPHLNPHDVSYNRSLHLLFVFMPSKQHWVKDEIIKYKIHSMQDNDHSNTPHLILFLLNELFRETVWIEGSPRSILSILSVILKYNRSFCVYFFPFLSELFHILYLCAQLPINSRNCILKKSTRLSSQTISSISFNRDILSTFIGFLIYLMHNDGDNDIVSQLFCSFLENTTNYFYPQENERSTSFSLLLTTILSSFSVHYTRRYWMELRGFTNTNCVCYDSIPTELKRDVFSWHSHLDRNHPFYREISDKYKLNVSHALFYRLQPIIKWSIYSKSRFIQFGGYTAIKLLCSLFPSIATDWALNEVRECLSAVTASHRLSIGIALFDCITPTLLNRYLLPQRVGETQLIFIECLKSVLFGIDPSLNKQCTLTMAYLDSIFSKIAIIKSSECGAEATLYFEEFALCFVDKILCYALDSSYALSTLKTSGSSAHTPGIKNFMPRSNKILLKKFTKCIYSFWFAISEDIYIKCRDKIIDVIINEPQCGELAAVIVRGMIYPYPQLSLDCVLPKIIHKIHRQDALIGSKQVLNYYLSLCEAAIVASHSCIIKYIPILSKIINICMRNSQPEIKKFAGALLQAIVVTLCREVPKEMRPFSSHIWKENGEWKHWEFWAQFAETEMKGLYKTWRPDLRLKWFYPKEEEFNAIQQLMDNVLTHPLKEIQAFMDGDKDTKLSAEQLLQYIRILYHFCYGIGHLGDFDVDKDSHILATNRQDNYFKSDNYDNSMYYVYKPCGNTYKTLNKLRSMLKLPLNTYNNVSLRTAFTRLSIRLYQKLSEYSDSADYVFDIGDLPQDLNDNYTDNYEILETEMDTEMKTSNDSNSLIKKSTLFPGVSKVLVWLNTFVNILMNHDGVMWGVVSNLNPSRYSKLLRSLFSEDIFTGHLHNHRAAYVHEAHGLTLKRLYFLFTHNSYTTDVRSLVEELIKCSISEFQNVRNQAIHAIISGRSIYNFRSVIDSAFRFWLKIIKDNKSDKCQLLGATKAVNNSELMTQMILKTSQRDREFINALLSASIHREPAVQSAVFSILQKYFSAKKYHTIYLPPNAANTEERNKEIMEINDNLKKEHELMQKQLLYIANNEKMLKLNDDNSSASSSFSDSSSFVKIPLMPDDPVVASLVSLISNLDMDTLNIDASSFDTNNITPQSLSAFLSKQGFNLPPTMFESLSLNQLKSIIESSQLSKFMNTIKSKHKTEKKEEKKTVNVHWKYQLVATILLWKSFRPNIAPNIKVIEYILKLIGNEIPSLNRVAVSALNIIIHNYVPFLHYKDILKDPKDFPIEHSFGWRHAQSKKQININDLSVENPLYMLPKAQLSSEAAAMIHEYLSNNLDVLCKAFASNHPNIQDPSAPQQSRRSSDTQLTKLIRLPFEWPYDGYNVLLNSWEHTHYLLMRDILRCKWPQSPQDTDITNWKYDENLWNMAIDQFNVYGKNMKEKEHQLASGEILSGILRAYHHFAAIKQLPKGISTQLLSSKITQPLLKIMQQCPQESEDAWCCAIRSGLANSDPKYVEWFTHPILTAVVSNIQIQHVDKDNDTDEDDAEKQVYISPDKQVRAMRYGTEILVSYGYRGEKEWRYILSSLTKPYTKIDFNEEYKEDNDDIDLAVFDCYFSNTYRSVRGDIGILLAHIVRCLRTKPSPVLSIYDVTTIDPQFTNILSIIETQYLSLWEKQYQEQLHKHQKTIQSKDIDIFTKKYDNFLQTICFWSLQCYNTSNMIYYQALFVRFLPLILCGGYREDKKTLEVVSMTTEVIAWTCFHELQVLTIFDALLDLNRKPKLINNTSWKLRKVVLQFLLQFISRNAVILNKNERYQRLITDYLIVNALPDKQLEVSITARNVLTALIQCTNMKHEDTISVLQDRFEKLARTKIPKRNYDIEQTAAFNKKLNIRLRKKHCGVLGLSSLILSVPYTCPHWIPQILSFISVFDRERAPIGTTSKKTVAEFKRTHQDEWHIFKKEFTTEQLSDIQDASSTSYFV